MTISETHGFNPVAFDKTVAILDEICDCKEKKRHRSVVEVVLATYFNTLKSNEDANV